MAVGLQRLPDRPDAAVHHVRGGHDIAAGLGLQQGLLHKNGNGWIIDDLAIFHKPVMAMAGVGIERHVAHDADFRHRRLDGAHRPADQIVLVKGLAGIGGPQRLAGVWKQGDEGNAQGGGFLGLPHGQINAVALNTRH